MRRAGLETEVKDAARGPRFWCYLGDQRLTGHAFGHDLAVVLTDLPPRNQERNPDQSTEYQHHKYYWCDRSRIRHSSSHP